MEKIFLSLLLVLSTYVLFSQADLHPTSEFQVINHTYYSLEYSEEHEQAIWVYYFLANNYVSGVGERKNNFKNDPNVSTGSATLADYKGSGYDRGHLCPAGSMKITQLAMDESFYMSNMSPQVPGFNRGIWKNLESQERDWVLEYYNLHIVTGPIFENNIEVIGDGVTVPGYYYKAIYDSFGEKKMIGFILPNKKLSDDISKYVVTIDEIEERINRDLFHDLPDDIETKLERTTNGWTFEKPQTNSSIYESSSNISKNPPSGAVQCKGIAKSTGVRCKNRTTSANGYCHHHQSQVKKTSEISTTKTSANKSSYSSSQCSARTKKGTRCKRKAAAGSSYCWQHK